MGPDFWTAFTFFGLPLALGILGVVRGLRLCQRAYRQYVTVTGPELGGPSARTTAKGEQTDRTWRENLAIGLVLVVGAGLLVAHSGRWLLRIL